MEDAESEEEPFDGIDIDSPSGRVRMGRGRGREFQVEVTGEEDAYRQARRRVRRRLRFYRHLTTFLVVNLVLLAFDGLTGGGYWVQWVAGLWGVFVVWEFLSTFVFPNLWGAEVERRMIERELGRRRGSEGDR